MSYSNPWRDAWRAALPFVAAAVFMLAWESAVATERGLPLITIHPPEIHRAGPQTFDIAQDTSGILYFGNLHGLLTYDGAWWRLRELPDDQVALSLATDASGRVAVGLINDFGYIVRSESGIEEYRSLLDRLPSDKREIRDVRAICTTTQGFLYVTDTSLLLWNGADVRIVSEQSGDAAPRGCLGDGDRVFLRGIEGVSRLDLSTGGIQPVGIDGHVMVLLRRSDGSIIAGMRDGGLFLIDGTAITPFSPAASEWMQEKLMTSGCRLADGRLVIATRQHGLALIADDGDLEQVVDARAGLPDSVINDVRVDREGALWIAMDGPIVRMDVASPVTLFDSRSGVRGSASDVVQFRGTRYAATSHGVFTIDDAGRGHRIEGMDEGAWRLERIDDELLVGTTRGIYRIDAAGAVARIVELETEVYDILRSASDPSLVWVGRGDGLAVLRRGDGGWTEERLLAEVPRNITSLFEHEGVLWAGSVFNGILKIEHPHGAQPVVRQFGSGEANVYPVNGRPFHVRATGRVIRLKDDGTFEPDPDMAHIQAQRGFFIVKEDASGNLWINSTPPRLYTRRPDGTYSNEGRPLVGVTASDIQLMRISEDGAVWFASDKGLFRYEGRDTQVHLPQPQPIIRQVIGAENRSLLRADAGELVKLRHDFGRIRLEFAPVSYRAGIAYQYRLDPIQTRWSEWIEEPFIDFTTLEPGEYTFRLRARGPAMIPSSETEWSFVVLPPWYRTRLAHAIWILLAIGVLAAVIRARTATLRRQAERLRAKVAEQTAELQNTVSLLEEANSRLEALSFEDDLTGIANRRAFEHSLIDECNRARRHDLPLSLILLDLDRFKELNDQRGHPAGDDCLRRIGAFLATAIRRSGEVVARYGGEEFAILLPGTGGEAAVAVAETLRLGILQLGIPYEATTEGSISASCGVATLNPGIEYTPEALVASADAALYAAKQSGRNCVRMADSALLPNLRDVSA
jgi:diguanylate cyclase (GGDEF)-like protein